MRKATITFSKNDDIFLKKSNLKRHQPSLYKTPMFIGVDDEEYFFEIDDF